eukprot:jgi/Bigna1/132619/aug1.18_g7327
MQVDAKYEGLDGQDPVEEPLHENGRVRIRLRNLLLILAITMGSCLGAFIFGYSLGFTSPTLLAMQATGIASMVVPMYITEISPPDYKGAYCVLNQLMMTLGILTVFVCGALIYHKRLGEEDQAISFINTYWGAGESGRSLRAGANLGTLLKNSKATGGEGVTSQSEFGFCDLLRRASELYNPMAFAFVLMILQQWSGVNAVNMYCAQIFQDVGFEVGIAHCQS